MSGADVVLAVVVVGAGSLLLRLVPFLATARLAEPAARAAAWAGVAVLAAFTVRAVLAHRDPEVAAPALLAVACLGLTLLVAVRGHPVVAAVAAGAGLYVVVATPWV